MASETEGYDPDDDEVPKQAGHHRKKGREEALKNVEIGPPQIPDAKRAEYVQERERAEAGAKAAKARELAAKAEAAVRRREAIERHVTNRQPNAFKFAIEHDTADPAALRLNLLDEHGNSFTDWQPRGENAQEVPVNLADYLPQLKDQKIIAAIKVKNPDDQTAANVYVDNDKTLRISPDFFGPNTTPDPVPIMTAVVEAAYRGRLRVAKEACDAAKAKLTKKEVREERVAGYHKAEETYRKAVAEITAERETTLKTILETVFDEQKVDLASGVGGREQLLKTRAEAMEKMKDNRFPFARDEKELEEPKGFIDSLGYAAKKGIRAVKHGANEFAEGMWAQEEIEDIAYKKEQEEIKKLPEGWWNDIRKSSPMEAKRWATHQLRKGVIATSGVVRTPLFAGAAVGGWTLKTLGAIAAFALKKPWGQFKEFVNYSTFGMVFSDDKSKGGEKKKPAAGGHH